MTQIQTKQSILKLIKEAESVFAGTGKALLDIEDYVAEYLTANGVIVPPCKVGDVVFEIEKTCFECPYCIDDYYSFCDCKLDSSKTMFETDFDKDCIYKIIDKKFHYGMIEQVGKTIFVSREDAEKALNERDKATYESLACER
jgi:hypothetical protein